MAWSIAAHACEVGGPLLLMPMILVTDFKKEEAAAGFGCACSAHHVHARKLVNRVL